jgi:hypothetical protein
VLTTTNLASSAAVCADTTSRNLVAPSMYWNRNFDEARYFLVPGNVCQNKRYNIATELGFERIKGNPAPLWSISPVTAGNEVNDCPSLDLNGRTLFAAGAPGDGRI